MAQPPAEPPSGLEEHAVFRLRRAIIHRRADPRRTSLEEHAVFRLRRAIIHRRADPRRTRAAVGRARGRLSAEPGGAARRSPSVRDGESPSHAEP
jgi:hypothetical protein